MTIPASVTEIGTQIFYKCDNLKTVYYNSTYSSSNNPFLNVATIEKVVFGEKTIPDYICQGCINIKMLEIKGSVTSIGDYAFSGCTNLKNVTFVTPAGWWYASSSSATSGTAFAEADLANTETAARYLTSTYRSHYNWYRD